MLTTDVHNLLFDPIQEERDRRQEVQSELTQGSRPLLGKGDGRKTIVVFSDFQCPFCRKAAEILGDLATHREDARIIFRYFPLQSHDWARQAAEAAACVYRQGNDSFWVFHDRLFGDQDAITLENAFEQTTEIAKATPGLDLRVFRRCVESHETAQEVEGDVQLGLRNDVGATPTLFVNGFVMPGVRSRDELDSMMDSIASDPRSVENSGRPVKQ